MKIRTAWIWIFVVGTCWSGRPANADTLSNLFPFPNATGLLATYNAGNQPIDLSGPFFQPLGSNGRSCGTCHRPAQAWSISATEVRARFEATQGLDPLFRTNDGSNCDHNIETSTVNGRRLAYSLLLDRALIRIALSVPSNAEFTVEGVVNPYGCNDASTVSVYRRTLPSTNLRFMSVLMWDGRESSTQTSTQKITYATYPKDLMFNLAHQVVDAIIGHAQGSQPPTPQQQHDIVNFEMALSTAQAYDYLAGALNSDGAFGGPARISSTTHPAFFIGINDPLGGNPRNIEFTPVIFNLFNAWANAAPHDFASYDPFGRRAAIVRGQTLFNSKPINITGVAGLNDDLNLASIPGTCGTCHDSPNIGNHSVAAPLNIGVGDLDSPLNLSYLPVFTLKNKTTHEIKKTTDPGRALVTGAWKDVGRLKGPTLRGLSSRAPYFHNGSARTLSDVLDFYNTRFAIGLTEREKNDLIAFLSAL